MHQLEIGLDEDGLEKIGMNPYILSYVLGDKPQEVKTILIPIVYLDNDNLKKWWHWDRQGWKIAAGIASVTAIVASTIYFSDFQFVEPSSQPVVEKPANWVEEWAFSTWFRKFKQALQIDSEVFDNPCSLTNDPDAKTNPNSFKQAMQKLYLDHSYNVFEHGVIMKNIKKLYLR